MVYEKVSDFKCQQILEMAEKFFQGEGLELEEDDNERCLNFKGGGGFVTISCCKREQENKAEVELETREWDRQVKKFMRKI